jgi:hypothetical protein
MEVCQAAYLSRGKVALTVVDPLTDDLNRDALPS